MRGLVVEIKDSRAIVLKDDGNFINVKNKNYKVGQKVKASSNVFANGLKIAACIVLCLITSAVACKFYYTPYSYLYVDINPSVRLDLNYFDIVIDCVPLNEDAEFIDISTSDIEDSINEIIGKCEEKGFLTEENNEIEINIPKENEKILRSVANVESKYRDTQYDVAVKNTTEQEIEKANSMGISVKRQRAIEEFSSVFGGDEKQNAEKLRDKATKEIRAIISNEQNENSKPVVQEEQEESAPENKLSEKPRRKPISNGKTWAGETPKQENTSVKEIPEEKIETIEPVENPKEEPPVIVEPEQEGKTPDSEQPKQDAGGDMPEIGEHPEGNGEKEPPHMSEDNKPDKDPGADKESFEEKDEQMSERPSGGNKTDDNSVERNDSHAGNMYGKTNAPPNHNEAPAKPMSH